MGNLRVAHLEVELAKVETRICNSRNIASEKLECGKEETMSHETETVANRKLETGNWETGKLETGHHENGNCRTGILGMLVAGNRKLQTESCKLEIGKFQESKFGPWRVGNCRHGTWKLFAGNWDPRILEAESADTGNRKL